MEEKSYLKKISSWDIPAARHILSRTSYGYTKSDVAFALSKTLDDFVDNYLLKDLAEPTPPGTWVTVSNNSTNQPQYGTYFSQLRDWWAGLMLNQNNSFRERMVLFLHNHFVSEYGTVQVPQFMYIQNKLFRQYSFGNFKELTKKITIDPAMLIYLNGNQNTKSSPNENYARELLELFTIGIGNYSETDIKEAAKALTGWRVNNTTLTSYFDLARFDSGIKNFLGATGNFGYEDVVNIIFNKPQTAEFICRKLYKEFVHYIPDETYISQLGSVMLTNNYELKPVLSALLKSVYFHSENIRGAKISSPIELIISTIKQFGIVVDSAMFTYIRYLQSVLQQDLFNPPDVRGWEGQRKWISSITYPTRNNFTDALINGKRHDRNSTIPKVDALTYARSYSSSEDAVQFVNDVTEQLIRFPLSQTRKDYLLTTLLDGTTVSNWSTYVQGASTRIEKFFKALMKLPEFQLS
jgi:uncharacterized protein (DUF1800 family)